MDNRLIDQYLLYLKSEIAPAMGCTEPAAVALAAAWAMWALNVKKPWAGTGCEPRPESEPDEFQQQEQLRKPIRIMAAVSPYIFKNGLHVGIPGIGMTGLAVAAALGAVSARPERKLMILDGLNEEQKQMALQMVAAGRVQVSLADTPEKIQIEIMIETGERRACAVIRGTHTSLVRLSCDGVDRIRELGRQSADTVAEPVFQANQTEPEALSVDSIYDFASAVPVDSIQFIGDIIRLNMKMAEEGLKNDYGLNIGKTILFRDQIGLYSGSLSNYAVALTAAAADARMAGCAKLVMTAAGSGNQGLTASIPIAAIASRLNKPERQVYRALVLSILITVHTKQYIGRLSALCGCSIAAAIGTCGGLVYLLDGTLDQIKAGIQTMVADIAGVVCDGAKAGCALKIATAVDSAIRSAALALNGIGADQTNGIVAPDVEQTLANLGKLGSDGMQGTNAVILDMMLDKLVNA